MPDTTTPPPRDYSANEDRSLMRVGDYFIVGRITVTRRVADWYANMDGNLVNWAVGLTMTDAVGRLVVDYPELVAASDPGGGVTPGLPGPEPWTVEEGSNLITGTRGVNARRVATTNHSAFTREEEAKHADRIAACVNFCAGYTTGDLSRSHITANIEREG